MVRGLGRASALLVAALVACGGLDDRGDDAPFAANPGESPGGVAPQTGSPPLPGAPPPQPDGLPSAPSPTPTPAPTPVPLLPPPPAVPPPQPVVTFPPPVVSPAPPPPPAPPPAVTPAPPLFPALPPVTPVLPPPPRPVPPPSPQLPPPAPPFPPQPVPSPAPQGPLPPPPPPAEFSGFCEPPRCVLRGFAERFDGAVAFFRELLLDAEADRGEGVNELVAPDGSVRRIARGVIVLQAEFDSEGNLHALVEPQWDAARGEIDVSVTDVPAVAVFTPEGEVAWIEPLAPGE